MNFDSLPLYVRVYCLDLFDLFNSTKKSLKHRLRSPNGFVIFWLLTLSAIFSILCVFRWKSWL